MTEKFQNKYRIDSARLQNWDYSWNAAYYITVCTRNRECYFGEIIDGRMIMSEMGEIANKYWEAIPKHFPFALLDEHVARPNHIHGIIQISRPNNFKNNFSNKDNMVTDDRDAINRVSTASIKTGGITGNKNPMNYENISRIMRWYKGRVSFETRKTHTDFAWQSRFYDHVIRNDDSLNKIRFYIRDNPKKWTTDQLNPDIKGKQQ